MLRVTTEEEPSRTIFTVDGQLSGNRIEVVETCCTQAMGNGKAVQLILRDVLAVDAAACALLHRLAAKGVSVFAKGVYTSYLVKSLR